jgi:hypothetical protein
MDVARRLATSRFSAHHRFAACHEPLCRNGSEFGTNVANIRAPIYDQRMCRPFQSLIIAVLATGCAPKVWTGAPAPLGSVVAVSDELGRSVSVRVLSDGRVIYSDETRLWMLDKNLKNPRLLGDSTAATGRLMDVPGTYVRPYLGDSTMLVKSGLGRIVILDEEGRPARRLQARYPADAGLGPTSGEWTVDMTRAWFTKRGDAMVLSEGQVPRGDTTRQQPIYVVRTSFADPERRDTVARLTREMMRRDTMYSSGVSWILTGDAAGMFPDGTIAVVRTKTYTVELIDKRGRHREVAIPHQWTVLTPADKQEIMDSLRAQASGPPLVTLDARSNSPNVTIEQRRPGTAVVSRLSDITDTVPPITAFNPLTGDASRLLWIQKITVLTNPYRHVSEYQYDVIDRDGRLVRRVSMPAGWQLRAFRPGLVYYTRYEGNRVRLYMARSR